MGVNALSAICSSTYDIAEGFAVAWCGVAVFDFIVVIMTLVRTVQINRSSSDHSLTHILIRDGESIHRRSFARVALSSSSRRRILLVHISPPTVK